MAEHTDWEALRKKYNIAQSSFHGVVNSFRETPRQSFQSYLISLVAKLSYRMRRSLTRMIDLLQEEIDTSKSLKEASPASNEFSPSTEPIEVLSIFETNFIVKVVPPKHDFNGVLKHLPIRTANTIIATADSFDSRNIVVDQGFEHTLESLFRKVALRLDNGHGDLNSRLQNPLNQPCQMIRCNQPSSWREFTFSSNNSAPVRDRWVAGRWDKPPPPSEPVDNLAVPAFGHVTAITRELSWQQDTGDDFLLEPFPTHMGQTQPNNVKC